MPKKVCLREEVEERKGGENGQVLLKTFRGEELKQSANARGKRRQSEKIEKQKQRNRWKEMRGSID